MHKESKKKRGLKRELMLVPFPLVTFLLLPAYGPQLVSSSARAHTLWSDGLSNGGATPERCSSSGSLKYLSGDALTDSTNCIGPNNAPYPASLVARTFSNWAPGGSSRRGRMSQLPTLDPKLTQRALLQAYGDANEAAQLETARTRYSKFTPYLKH
ncbi:AGAP005368-PA-like protein [Anopheles sinensis]|uniref:AGAP005368-PA-like protein n=1 Tax=Anopheles sinensis TaxID=74873 RepID=A0A084WEW3_ANOSI|nr:AGAP005368-PA-like protein [Anopheles sinensis]